MRMNNAKLADIFVFMLKFTLLGIPLLLSLYYPFNFYELEFFQASSVAYAD